jgi:hypothetical protein
MKVFYTYIHRQADDGSVFYVGKGSITRARTASGRSNFWKRVVNKHGKVVEICAGWDTEQEAFEHEKFLILCFKDMGCRLTNMTNGGEGTSGRKMPPEQYEKHVARMRLQSQSPEFRKKISERMMGENHPLFGKPAPNKGKPMLSHVKAAMMAKHVSVNPEAMAKMIASKKGVKLTDEHKEKLSKAHMGKPKSEAMRTKLSWSKTGYRYTPEAKEKMRQSRLAFLAKQKEKKNEVDQ